MKTFGSAKAVLAIALLGVIALALACAGKEAPTAVPTATPTTSPAATPTQASRPTSPTAASTSTTSAPAVVKPLYGGTLRQAINLSMKSLDPFHNVDWREQQVEFLIYDSLVRADSNFNVIPDLARSWDYSADGKSITFRLVQGAKFHDGSEFNADVVQKNFAKLLDPAWNSTTRADFAPAVDNVKVVDSSTVVINLKQAWRPFISNMTSAKFGMISIASQEKYGDNYPRNPSGTGPFKLKEWAPGDRIILVKNDSYREAGKPYLDSIVFLNVPDASVQLAMLRTGDAELVDEVLATSLPLLQNNPKIKVMPFQTRNWWSMLFKVDTDPFTNKALRQAVAYALDRQKIVDVYLAGQGSPAYANGASWYNDPSYEPYKYDAQKAKTKLAEAGFPNGVTIPYWCDAADVEQRLCELVQSILSNVNIKADIITVPSSDYYTNINTAKTKFGKMAYFPRPDPDYVMRSTLHSTGFRTKVLGYKNAEVDKLVDDAAATYDTAKAGQMYVQAQKIVFDEAVYTGLYYPKTFAAMSSKVQNFQWWLDTLLRLKDVWIEK